MPADDTFPLSPFPGVEVSPVGLESIIPDGEGDSVRRKMLSLTHSRCVSVERKCYVRTRSRDLRKLQRRGPDSWN